MKKAEFIQIGIRTLDMELEELRRLRQVMDKTFAAACAILLECKGRIIVIGMGKSGHIARKIAATFTSTGSPAFFVHPGEAGHGDMGTITADDIVLLLSYSGKTDEVVHLLPLIKRLGVKMISITGDPNSVVAKTADVHLQIHIKQEACPLNLAPTSSTTATLVLGDALAIALLEARGFTAEDFAFSHPSGSLGKKLLLKVNDIMHAGKDLPLVTAEVSVASALVEMTSKQLGMTTVVNANRKLIGVFTDGDLRRWLDKGMNVHETAIMDVMTRQFRTIHADALAAEALQMMEREKINSLPVLDKNDQLIGAINMHDLLRQGVL